MEFRLLQKPNPELGHKFDLIVYVRYDGVCLHLPSYRNEYYLERYLQVEGNTI